MTLSWNEVVHLLEGVTHFDNRRVDEEMVTAWMAIANTRDWTVEEAQAAVVEHFGESQQYLKPAHITTIIKTRRQDALMKATVKAITANMGIEPAKVEQNVAAIYSARGWSVDERPALKVRCPFCGAQPKQRCTRMSAKADKRVLTKTHPSRLEAAEKAA